MKLFKNTYFGVCRLFFLVVCFLFTIGSFAEAFKLIGAHELAQQMKNSSKPVYVFDANGAITREDAGIIPGAKLLSSHSKYDVTQELPKDKKSSLVFYCANSRCMASHTAAERAIKAGYNSVSVMSDGIFGWKKAGLPAVPALTKPGKTKELDPKSVSQLVELGFATIVDVRESEERTRVVPGATFFPMSDSEDDTKWERFSKDLSKNKWIVFHCQSGRRAQKIAARLSEQGFSTGYFKGPDQWKEAGLPLQKGSD